MKSRTGLFMLTVLAVLAAAPAAANACTITWDGQVSDAWFEVQVNGPGTGDDVYNWSPERWPTGTDDVCIPAGPAIQPTTRQVDQNTPTMRSLTISLGASLTVSATQVLISENSSNAGTLNMSGPLPLTINDGNSGDGAEGLTNTGTINFTNQGAANGQLATIVADLFTNQGTVNVNDPEASIQRSGAALLNAVHSNQSTINISSGNALRSIFSNFINAGTITGGGSMNMDQGRFEAASGSSIGAGTDVNMTNSIFAAAPGSTATGNVDIYGAFNGGGPSVLEGTVPAGITLDVEPGVTLQSPAVTTTVNAGRININGDGAQLQVLPNDVGTNSTSRLTNTGTIEFTTGGGTQIRSITGALVNQGSLVVNHPQASFQAPGGTNTPPRLTNNGTISISSGNAMRAIQSPEVINGTGGAITGAGTMNHDAGRLSLTGNSQISAPLDYNLSGAAGLDLTSAAAASGNVDIAGGTSVLTGNVPSGVSIDIRNAGLRSMSSYTNAGTITLNRVTGDFANPTLSTEDGVGGTTETLTNTGTIAVTGNLSTPTISGNLINQGTFSTSNPFVVFDDQQETRPPKLTNAAGGTLTVAAGSTFALWPGGAQNFENAGTVQVNGNLNPLGYTQTGGTTTLAAGGALNLSPPEAVLLQGGVLRGSGNITGGDVVNSGGTLAPGTSPGILTLTDDYVQGAGGNLAIEVSGADAGTGHDQLVVGGTASLGGTLSVDTSGFSPATGQQFKIIDAPAPPASPTVSGTFATIQPTGGRTYAVAYGPTAVTLTADAPPVVPDPPVVDPPIEPDPVNPPGPPGPPADDGACKAATDKLANAKTKLKKLKRNDASAKKIKKAKAKVKKAKQAVAAACA